MEKIHPISVLVVEDSAFFRKTLKNMLESDPLIQVIGTAEDGIEALEKIEKLRPDVVTLDIEMPRMNGLEVLKVVMEKFPLPVIMISSITKDGAEATLDALHMGAIDYIPKNLSRMSSNVDTVRDELLAKVKAVAKKGTDSAVIHKSGASESSYFERKIRSGHVKNLRGSQSDGHSGRYLDYKGGDDVDLVSLGASTGGPRALQEILIQLPGDFPAPIIITQHMPGVFTKPFAERINKLCEIEIKEAEDNDIIKSGVALLAPGGYQMRVRKRNRECRVEISNEPKESIYKPSVDITMMSASQSFGKGCVGVILTGMGSDGLEGMRAIKSRGGMTIAQNKKSCVVYGMPKMVIEAGVADKTLSLDDIVGELLKQVHYSLLSA